MKQAAAQSGLLQSVVFDVAADVWGTPSMNTGLKGTAHLSVHGVTQDHGRLTQADIVLDGTVEGVETHAVRFDVSTVAEESRATYFFLRSAEVSPPHPLLPTEALTTFGGQWWKMNSARADAPGASISPDPGLLLAQSQVITVTRDNGIRRIRGNRAYVYDIAVNPESLVSYLKKQAQERKQEFDEQAAQLEISHYSATGQLWVDARTFLVHRVTWDIRRRDEGAETLRIDLAVDFSGHNDAPAITPPVSAKTFGSTDFLNDASNGGTLLPEAGSLVPLESESTLLDMFRTAPVQP